jgi:hypothetical protein
MNPMEVSRGIAASERAIGMENCTQGEVERRVKQVIGIDVLEDVLKAIDTRLSVGEGAPREKLDEWARLLRPLLSQHEAVSWIWNLINCLRGWDSLSRREDKR